MVSELLSSFNYQIINFLKTDQEEMTLFYRMILKVSIFSDFVDAKKQILPLFESLNSSTEENNLRLAFRVDLTATNMVNHLINLIIFNKLA